MEMYTESCIIRFNSLCLSGASALPQLGTSGAAEQELLSDVKAVSTAQNFPVQLPKALLGPAPFQALRSQDSFQSLPVYHLLCGRMPV